MDFEHDLQEHQESNEELEMEISDSSNKSDNEEARIKWQEQLCTSLDNLVNRSHRHLLSLRELHDKLKYFSATFIRGQNELLQRTKLINQRYIELLEIALPSGVDDHVQNEISAHVFREFYADPMSKIGEEFKKFTSIYWKHSEELARQAEITKANVAKLSTKLKNFIQVDKDAKE